MDLWKHHRDDTPFCQCRVCYWARRDGDEENMDDNNDEDMHADSFLPQFIFAVETGKTLITPNKKPLRRPLEVRIAEDIGILTANFGGHETENEPHKGGKELPDPDYDLSAYKDAYEYAIKNCMHNNVSADNPFNPKFVNCNECQKSMTYEVFIQDRKRQADKMRRHRH